MILAFRDRGTQDIFNGENTKFARKACPQSLWKVTTRKLDDLESATTLHDLSVPPGNKLEALTSDRASQHNIRINNQYRICFIRADQGPDQVEITDYQ